VDGAIAQYREAIRINPKCSNAYNSLGLALREKGEDDAAVASLQQAIQCDPINHHPYNNLGYISKDRGDLNEAIAYFQKALQIKPDYYYTHVGMGLAHWEKGELEEASASFREALRINPKYESAYGHLSQILYEQGDLSGAIFACENALRLNPKLEDVQQRLSKLKKQSALLPRLEETIQGISKPFTAAEGCDFAWLCAEPFRQQYAAATRLYASAFAADQKSAAQLREGYNNRYHASAAAALAGCGKGTDAPSEPEARAALRRQSLEWLRLNVTNLASTKKQNIAKRLSYWLNDPAFAGVRPGPERVDMPDSERMEWDNFWSDLQKMYDKAQK
jgi:tetratricopeptide (TPR) repeat protein